MGLGCRVRPPAAGTPPLGMPLGARRGVRRCFFGGWRAGVFKHLNDWWEEFRLYHRKDGKVVKEGDDLMSATRYGTMMLRFAGVLTPRAKRIVDRPMGAYAWMV
jgi:hypothetical protein